MGEKTSFTIVSEKKCSVILNYPDQSVFYKREKRRKDDRFMIIYPGSLNWHQGLDIAIRAFAGIKDQVPVADFYIYGRGPEKNHLKSLVKNLALDGRVFVREAIPLDQIAEIMSNADLGIVPKRNSTFGGEAFSTKILEFMSLEVPVIVSDTKIDKHYFNDSVVKFFNPEDENDLANKMLLLIKDIQLRKQLSTNAAKFVEAYSWKIKKEIYLEIVDVLTGNRLKPTQGSNNA